MEKTLFVYASDTHLCQHMWSGRPEVSGDSVAAFEYIVNQSIAKSVPLVLGGDNFDRKAVDPQTAEAFARTVRNMNDWLFFVEGNHDLSPSVAWPTALSHNCHDLGRNGSVLIANETEDNPAVSLSGISYTGNQDQFDARVSAIKKELEDPEGDFQGMPRSGMYRILVCHEMYFLDTPTKIDLTNAARVFDMILIGDYHVNQIGTVSGKLGLRETPTTLVSNGATVITNFGEIGTKYYTEVFVRDRRVQVQFVPLPTFRTVRRVKVDEASVLSGAIDPILHSSMHVDPESIFLPILHLSVPNAGVAELIRRQAKEMGVNTYLFFSVKSKEDDLNFEDVAVTVDDTVADYVNKLAEEINNSKSRELFHKLAAHCSTLDEDLSPSEKLSYLANEIEQFLSAE